MIIQSFFTSYAALWVFILVTILTYAALVTIKLPGSKFILALTSVLFSILLVSSTSITNYLANLFPFLFLILIITFTISLILVFLVTKDLDFKKIMAITGFILAIIFCIFLAFSHFSGLNSFLPNSSSSNLNPAMSQVKDFVYSQDVRESILFIILAGVVFFFLIKKK
jgi:hypothetical protein